MRHARRAVTLAVLQNLTKRDRVVDALGVISPKHSVAATTAGFSRARAWADRARPITTVRSSFKCEAKKVGSSNEDRAFAGGAEDVAAWLAGGEGGTGGVFYNRVGAINRDLSVLLANVLAEERLHERSSRKSRRRRRPTPPSHPPIDDLSRTEAIRNSDSRGTNDALDSWEEGYEEDEEGLMVLDAFAASGVRALRYLTEVPGVRRVVANDYDPAAIEFIRKAADLCGAGEELETHYGDALDTMYAARAGGLGTYDIIDVDPFGCAGGFLDASVQAVNDGGLLCITSTDMPVLSGVQPEVAFARYGSVPTRSGYHHEMSLRILLHATSAAAGRHRRSIKPVLSIALDHYVRVFVRVFRSPKDALAAAQDSASYVLQSEACASFFLLPIVPRRSPRRGRPRARHPSSVGAPDADPTVPQSTLSAFEQEESGGAGRDGAQTSTSSMLGLGGACPETGGSLKAGGPIWSGPLHDEAWVSRALSLVVTAAAEAEEEEEEDLEHANKREPRHGCAAEIANPSSGVEGSTLLGEGGARRPRLASGARVESLLRAVSRELPDAPLFYNLRDMFATLGLGQHPRREQVMGALEAAGYRTSGMHKEPLALKTDAPDAAVWDILRCWARDNPQPPPVRAAGLTILARGPQLIADADFETGQVDLEGRVGEMARGKGDFLHAHNPEGRWGPLARKSVMVDAVLGGEEEEENVKTPAVLSEC